MVRSRICFALVAVVAVACPEVADAQGLPPPTSTAAPATPAPTGGAHASFNDGVTIESADSRFGFRIGAVVQYRGQANQMVPTPADPANLDPNHWHAYFNSFFMRPQVRLHAFGNQLKLFFQPEFAGRALDCSTSSSPTSRTKRSRSRPVSS